MDKRAIIDAVDRRASHLHLKIFGERAGLSAFLFHAIFRNEKEIACNQINPQERMTVDRFRRFLDYFLSNGYRFVTPEAVHDGLDPHDDKYGLITFDDGYFNNTLVPEILAEYKVPAVFFISSAYIVEGKKFWSDVVYQKRKKQKVNDLPILIELMSLKTKKIAEVEQWLVQTFGPDCMRPLSDIDRPMTIDELSAFAKQPYVYIGNHTNQHEILTNLSREEVGREFADSQEWLQKITGAKPWFVSYPNGSFSDKVIDVAVQHGLDTGITTIMRKNKLPLRKHKSGQLLLDRFNPSFDIQGRDNFNTLRSSLQLKTQLKRWLQ